MRFFRFLLLSLWMAAFGAQAGLPDYQAFPANGERLLLWVASERGRAEPEMRAAQKLAEQGVEVWSLDLVNAYFLPQLSSSMDEVPAQDLADWLRAAQAGGKQVVVYTVARAAVPVLRAAALLDPAQRTRLCDDFVECVDQFITDLQRQVECESGLFRFDHHIMQLDRFACQKRFLRGSRLFLQIIHRIDRIGQEVAEIRLRNGLVADR